MDTRSDTKPQLLIVTGGIACGKSTFTRYWAERNTGTSVFCADSAVHDLYNDAGVSSQVAAIVGMSVLSDEGLVDRSALRKKVFGDDTLRSSLEKLIHPLVRIKFQEAISEARVEAPGWILADIPLYFERGGGFSTQLNDEFHLISTIVVACSEETQIERLRSRNGFDKQHSESILRSQMPVSEKILRADFVIWNEGAEQVLHRQTELLSGSLEAFRK